MQHRHIELWTPRYGKHALSTAEVAAHYSSPTTDLAGRQSPLQRLQLSTAL